MAIKNVAIDVAKETRKEGKNELTLSNGVRVRFTPITLSALEEARTRIPYPPVPKLWNADKEREEDNPIDPMYIKMCQDVDNRRGMAALDVMLMLGVELVDGVPPKDTWIKKLELLRRLGHISYEGFNIDDDIDLEFLYKKYVLGTAGLLKEIEKHSIITEEMMAEAEKTFQRNR